MPEAVYGLTSEQHAQVGTLVRGAKTIVREQPGQPSKGPDRYRGICRVMLRDEKPINYVPLTPRTCSLFRYSPNTRQITVMFSGAELEGDLAVTIDGVEIHVDCKATHAELRAALVASGIAKADCRATVFPGLWEFSFTGRWSAVAPSFTCVAFEPPAEDVEASVYSGELQIVNEAWLSASDDGDEILTVDTIDWVPFSTDAITPGAIGGAQWGYGAGWLVLAWQCREWSFTEEVPSY